MKKTLETLDSRQGLFKPATLPELQHNQTQVVESECCDLGQGECDC